jgi:biotin carboxyl carrier protein
MNGTDNPPRNAPAKTVRRRWLYLVLALAFLFVLMPFLFWQGTWFGRPLTDAQLAQYLADQQHPRKAQHALSQIADHILSPNPNVRATARRWYPQVVAASASPVYELRLTAAWVMGQDNSAAEFHQALLRLLDDPHPMVQRNAALSLVRFGNATGRPIIVAMLEPYAVRAPHAGTLATRLKVGDVVNPGTLMARIQDGEQKTEVRSQVPGTLARWAVQDGATAQAGEVILLLTPSPEIIWEALRALYLIGRPEDLPTIEPYARGVPAMPDMIRQQAALTAEAIRSRAH